MLQTFQLKEKKAHTQRLKSLDTNSVVADLGLYGAFARGKVRK